MSIKLKVQSSLLACALAVIGFELAIYLDGVLSGWLHDFVEYLFTVTIFINDKTTVMVSLLSTALAHSIVVLVLVGAGLWLVKVNTRWFIVAYLTATALVLMYRVGGVSDLSGILWLFILVRFVFHVIWVPLWLAYFSLNQKN